MESHIFMNFIIADIGAASSLETAFSQFQTQTRFKIKSKFTKLFCDI